MCCLIFTKAWGQPSFQSPRTPFMGKWCFAVHWLGTRSAHGYWLGHCLQVFSLDRAMKCVCGWLVGFFFFFSKNILWVCTDASNLNSGYTVFTMSVSTFGSPFSHVKTSDLSGPNMIIDLLYLIITHKNIRITILIAI